MRPAAGSPRRADKGALPLPVPSVRLDAADAKEAANGAAAAGGAWSKARAPPADGADKAPSASASAPTPGGRVH